MSNSFFMPNSIGLKAAAVFLSGSLFLTACGENSPEAQFFSNSSSTEWVLMKFGDESVSDSESARLRIASSEAQALSFSECGVILVKQISDSEMRLVDAGVSSSESSKACFISIVRDSPYDVLIRGLSKGASFKISEDASELVIKVDLGGDSQAFVLTH